MRTPSRLLWERSDDQAFCIAGVRADRSEAAELIFEGGRD